MLDRLPVELVQHVVRLTLPSPSHITYRERRDPLLALCRTSRGLRRFAQPALLEVFEVALNGQVSSLFGGGAGRGPGRDVRLQGSGHQAAIKPVKRAPDDAGGPL
ncbi:hypothetical protein JCM10213_003812 [Rhodosporidiobolus nylandii]